MLRLKTMEAYVILSLRSKINDTAWKENLFAVLLRNIY